MKEQTETPEEKAQRRAEELIRISREQGVEAAREAFGKLVLGILAGRK